MRRTHAEDNRRQRNGDDSQNNPAAEAIDQPADADREERADQGGPKVYAREVDAIDLQIAQERLGYESEALCAAGQRADHCERRDEDVHPAVIKRQRKRTLTNFSSHKKSRKESRYCALSTDQNP